VATTAIPLVGAAPPPPPPPSGTDPAAAGDGGKGGRATRLAVLGLVVALLAAVVAIVAFDDDDDELASDDTEQVESTTTTRRPTATTRTTRTTSTTATSTTVASAVTTPTAPPGSPTTVATRRPARYGDSPALDALYDRCKAADYAACDRLYRQSDAGTEYQRYGDTCGNRNTPGRYCTEIYGSGGDTELDALAQRCQAGDMAACDRLYAESPAGSEYEEYGLTCGGRNEPSLGLCTDLYPT
jgi:hypothetical protein